MAKDLWVETYRPTTVKEYVFKDDTQRKQVQNWINDGGIPHLLFSGSPGTGKCLDYNERVLVKIDVSGLTDEQLRKLHNYRSTTVT